MVAPEVAPARGRSDFTDHIAGQLKPLVVPQLVAFAEHEGQPVAACRIYERPI